MSSSLKITNPYNGEAIDEIPYANPRQIAATLDKASGAFSHWKESAAWERADVLLGVRGELERQRNDFADLMAREAGKPITLAQAEIDRALGVLSWAAAEAQRFSGELLRLDSARGGRAGFGIHTRFPRGVVLGITPFNFPLNLVLHKIAPAVACGNSIVIKPSPFTPLTALKIMGLFEKFCPGVVQCLVADDGATEKLTQAPEVAMVSFTGSARVGKLIRQQACGKPVVLELGGNAWVIVMEDVPESAFPSIAKRIANAGYGYAGQSCISVQNIAGATSSWNALQESLRHSTESFAYGDPLLGNVLSGPVIHRKAADRIRGELAKAQHARAQIVRAGNPSGAQPSETGNLIAPSMVLSPDLVTAVPTELRSLQQDEIFAPIMLAGRFDSLDSLVATINSSPYGLQAGVFTQNLAAIERLYRELEVGGVVVNDVPTTRYDHQPYGGIKESGEGREGIRYAMEEMTFSKFLALSSQPPS